MERQQALVVSSDQSDYQAISAALRALSIEADGVSTLGEAIEILRVRPVQAVFARAEPGSTVVAEVIAQTRRLRPSTVLIAIGDRDGDAAALIRAGAFEVIIRPLRPRQIGLVIEKALAQHRILEEVGRLRAEIRGESGERRLVGRSSVMERIREQIARLAGNEDGVLLTGEPGTGKELAARVLHRLSPRRAGAFVVVRGGDAEPELAGPSGGTLFLDEVAELSAEGQAVVVETMRSGSPPDVRVVASTAANLGERVRAGGFREDLLHQLSAGTITMPPLRERTDDIVHLVHHFIDSVRALNDLPPIRLLPDTLHLLERYRWPRNVDELRHVVEQAVLVSENFSIRVEDLPETVRSAADSRFSVGFTGRFREQKRQAVDTFERRYLRDLMTRYGGNVTAAASAAGMLRSALQRLLRKHDLRSSAFRRDRQVSRSESIE